VTLLTTKALDFGDSQTGHADLSQCFADFFELERFDDGGDLFHGGALRRGQQKIMAMVIALELFKHG